MGQRPKQYMMLIYRACLSTYLYYVIHIYIYILYIWRPLEIRGPVRSLILHMHRDGPVARNVAEGRTSDASRLRNLRRGSVEGSVAKRAEEPPKWPGRRTSGASRLRNLRHRSGEGSATERRIRASDQLKP